MSTGADARAAIRGQPAPAHAGTAIAGQAGLPRAAIARETAQPPPWLPCPHPADHWPPVYLTVSEAAWKLSQHRSSVLRLIHTRRLRTIRLGRTYRIPETEIHRHVAPAPCDGGTLDIADCARILRCQPATICALLHHGHLTGERTGQPGHYSIPVAEFQRFLSQATR